MSRRLQLFAAALAGLTAAGASAEAGPKAQARPHGKNIEVPPALVDVDDGDTAMIRWSKDDVETVRILGIDAPETQHPEHDLPYAQPFGDEARGFARGAFAAATKIELLRAPTTDPFGRTLGYFFLNGRNYSVLAVQARMAMESVTTYGDNGLAAPAADVLAAAQGVGPLPFEPPHLYRKRMRELSRWLDARKK